MFAALKSIARKATQGSTARAQARHDTQMLAIGRLLCRSNRKLSQPQSLHDYEFKIFSQFGDDGIIQWLIHALQINRKTFIEFGVADYFESNTRFLLMNNNWSGLVLDGSPVNVQRIRANHQMWRHELHVKAAFVTRDNVNQLVSDHPFGREIGLLHIDVDGNDYWLWQAIDSVSPAIAIIEYNSVFGCDRAITVPYRADFQRRLAHHSNLYYGASLPALHDLATSKGYTLVGCNSAGNNAYFIRNDSLTELVPSMPLHEAYVESKFREGRDRDGQLTFLNGEDRANAIRGLAVWNTRTKCTEPF